MGRSINLVVVHCSASPDGDGLNRPPGPKLAGRSAAQIIDAWHAERGFRRTHPNALHFNPELKHIGYHYVIPCDGKLQTGRSTDEPGAHAAGYNANSVGICLTGTGRFTRLQFTTLAATMQWLAKMHKIDLRAPRRIGGVLRDGFCGHRDLSPDTDGDGFVEPIEWLKTCPGFNVADFIERGFEPPPEALLVGATA